jgi:hypothetical protein
LRSGAIVYTIRPETGDLNSEATVFMTQPETGGLNSEATVFTTQPETGWGRNTDFKIRAGKIIYYKSCARHVLGISKMLRNSNVLQKEVFSMKNAMKWFWIIAFVAVIGFAAASCNGSGGGFSNAKWEYMVFNHETNRSEIEDLNKKLNELGVQGWELVSSSPIWTSDLVVILKRKL